MIEIELYYRTKSRLLQIYHEWDCDPDDVCTIDDIRNGIIKKYVKFNDGSNWIAKLFGTYNDLIYTNVGHFCTSDIVCICIPKMFDTYEGIPREELHKWISPLSYKSQRRIYSFLHGKDVSLTMKEIHEANKTLSESLTQHGIDVDFIVSKLLNEVTAGSAQSRMYSLKVLASMVGVHFDGNSGDKPTPPMLPPGSQHSPINIPYTEVN